MHRRKITNPTGNILITEFFLHRVFENWIVHVVEWANDLQNVVIVGTTTAIDPAVSK